MTVRAGYLVKWSHRPGRGERKQAIYSIHAWPMVRMSFFGWFWVVGRQVTIESIVKKCHNFDGLTRQEMIWQQFPMIVPWLITRMKHLHTYIHWLKYPHSSSLSKQKLSCRYLKISSRAKFRINTRLKVKQSFGVDFLKQCVLVFRAWLYIFSKHDLIT